MVYMYHLTCPLDSTRLVAMICERYKTSTWDNAFLRTDEEDEEAYKEKLTKLKKSLKKDVVTWSKLFQIEFNAVPTKDDRKKYGFDMFRVYGNVSYLYCTATSLPLSVCALTTICCCCFFYCICLWTTRS